jgi:D-lactate dehydrogenase (cytochrome)
MMHDTVLAHGSVSAEHGIGKLKTDYLKHMYGEQGIEEMKKVKKALDPNWILSRGNLFEI